ncbi:MAG: acyl carrier protein [Ruminococcaceae bacterium]|nr:acyl carrier protein [Oscillospiraceae bacterium]
MIFEKLKSIITEQINVDADEITLDTSFIDGLGADSLDLVELMIAMEEEFEISIPEEDIDKISTVGDAVEYIESHSN